MKSRRQRQWLSELGLSLIDRRRSGVGQSLGCPLWSICPRARGASASAATKLGSTGVAEAEIAEMNYEKFFTESLADLRRDRKSTRLNYSPNANPVCRLLLEKKK